MEISSTIAHPDTVSTTTHAETQTEPPEPLPRNSRTMPYSYLHLLSRISTRATPSPAPHQPEMNSHSYQGIMDLLLRQPPEIRQLVLNWLESRDLLNLRVSSRTLHNTIHDSERAICVGLAEHISKYHNLHNIAIPIPNLSAFFRVSQQYGSICRLAHILSDRLSGYATLITISPDDKEGLETWRKRISLRLEKRLARALLVLQHYLNYFLETIITNEKFLESLDDDDYNSLHNIFDLDQQDFLSDHMSSLTESDFIDVTASLAIFKSVCKARYIPFNLKIHSYPFASVRQILIYKGLGPFADLLAKDITSAQQDISLRRLGREIAQARKPSPPVNDNSTLPTIHHFSGYRQSLTTHCDLRRSSKARDLFISHQDIWDRAARALMMPKLGRFPTVQNSATWIMCVLTEDQREQDVQLGTWDKAERTQ